MKNDVFAVWQELLKTLQKNLDRIFTIHICYIVFGVLLFTPLAGLAGQFLLHLSGQTVLSDLDIAYFVLTPTGIIALILFAALMITIIIFELTSLMAVSLAVLHNKVVTMMSILSFTVKRAIHIFLFSLNLVMRVLLITLPFLAASAIVAWLLISDYDINYYLTARPPAFLLAVGIIGLLLTAMLLILVRKLLGWSFALPLVLFNNTPPVQSFGRSEKRVKGYKKILLVTLGVLMVTAGLINIAIFGSLQLFGSILVPLFENSISRLALVLGGLVTLMALANVLVTAITSAGFALVLVSVYLRTDPPINIGEVPAAHQDQKIILTAPRCMILLAAVTAFAVFAGNRLLQDIKAPDNTLIIAHRGSAGKTPENTIAAVRQAIKDGADWIEIDVQESLDGVVVVFHDSDFMKFAGVETKVWEARLDQIKEIDVGSWFAPEFSSERVPTLAEVLEEARGKSKVLIELKYYGHDQLIEQRVVDIVEQKGMVNDVAIMSLNLDGIKKFHALRPAWPVGLLLSKVIGSLSDLDVDFLGINMAAAKPGFMKRVQSEGKQIFVWTVNDSVTMSRMISLGADGIITDEPELAVDVLKEHARMIPVERLLIHTVALLNKPIPERIYRDESP